MITVYGIKNCDTIKKALKWLTEHDVVHQFHDVRKDGLTRNLLALWCDRLGHEALLNKRGTTWRKLPEAQKENLSEEAILDLLLEHPAMIKRPVFDFDGHYRLGFSSQDQAEIAVLLGIEG